MSRAAARKALFAYKVTHNHYDRSCLAGRQGKLRVAYPSARLLKPLSARQRKRLHDRVVIALTANPHYALDGIHPRTHTSLRRVRRRLTRAQHLKIGLNTWYFIRGRHATGVLKVQRGTVGEIGIANRTLTSTRAQQHRLLTSFRRHPRR